MKAAFRRTLLRRILLAVIWKTTLGSRTGLPKALYLASSRNQANYVRIYNVFLTLRRLVVSSIPEQIMRRAEKMPEGALLCPRAFLDLGKRAAIDQAFSRLAHGGRLMRVCQGVYVLPIKTRFGSRPPSLPKVIESWSELFNETIVPSGGAAANNLGLTTQVPVRPVYLTSGADRELVFGQIKVTLRNAPRLQLAAPGRPAGDAVRALSWLGPEEIQDGLEEIDRRLSEQDMNELARIRSIMPSWMAEPLSALIADA